MSLKLFIQYFFISLFLFVNSQTSYALTPDQYEYDNIISDASHLFVGKKFSQIHTLHNPEDIDWIMFKGIEDHSYEITAIAKGGECHIQLALLEFDGQTEIKSSLYCCNEYSIVWGKCPITRLYLIKVMPIERCESGITYELYIKDTSASTTQAIWGYVKDLYCKTPISGVEVSIVNISNGKSRSYISRDGFYNNIFFKNYAGYYCFEDHPIGEYRLSAKKYHLVNESSIYVTLESNMENPDPIEIGLTSKCSSNLPFLIDKEIQVSDIISILQIISGVKTDEAITVCSDNFISIQDVIVLLKCLL